MLFALVVTILILAATVSWALRCCCFRIRRVGDPCLPFPNAPRIPLSGDPLRRGIKLKELPQKADAIVVGGGASGLACACLLTRRGYRVLVLEQHDRAGGGLHSFTEKNAFEFDTGFHYSGELRKGEPLRCIVDALTNSEVDFQVLDECLLGKGFYDEVRFTSEEKEGNRYKPFRVPAGKQRWINALKAAFPDEEIAIDAYVKDMHDCVSQGLTYQIWRSFPKDSWLSRITYPILASKLVSYQYPAAVRLDELTDNARLKALLGYISVGCCAVLPHEIQYATMLGLHAHFSNGAMYPVGGPASIARAMVRQIEDGGGRVLVRAAVDRIVVDPTSGKVQGVQIVKQQRVVLAPVVVSSIGIRPTVSGLLRSPSSAGPSSSSSCFSGKELSSFDFPDPIEPRLRVQLQRKVAQLPHGKGHIYGFLGLNGSAEELELPRRNVWTFPSHDLRGDMEKFQQRPDRFPFGYIGLAFPSAKDPEAGRKFPGKSTGAFICGDVLWEWFEKWKDTRIHKRGEDYESFKNGFKERMLEVLYKYYPKTKGRVEHFDLGTPLDTNYYLGRLTGASYGIPPTPQKGKADVEWLRPVVDEFPDGMFVCGQDLTVDGFAPACLSALMAMAAIEGPTYWLEVIPMLGGIRRTLEVLSSG